MKSSRARRPPRSDNDRPLLRQTQLADSGEERPLRCAIYTRVSTDDGLKQDFNSLDAQRESAEHFIAAHKHEGWACLPDRYDDGGFSGGNMDRPALSQLLAHVDAGHVDCIVVYKLDRLSRSIVDFGRLVEGLQSKGVDFRSVTEPVDTATATGRLVLNTLMSFAQHYREQIAERTRDKMRASRRRGKWIGGMQLLGYDVAPEGGRLIVNEQEAEQVRAIFALYLKLQALIPTVEELNRRGWTTKSWVTREGKQRQGVPFDKARLRALLTNRTYTGKLEHDGVVFDGEHDAVLDEAVWERARALMRRNARTGGKHTRNKHGATLRGLLWCGPCESVMVHTYTKKKDKRYRYYVCRLAQLRGWAGCPTKAVPAEEIERFVADHIRVIGRDPDLQRDVLSQTTSQIDGQTAEFDKERKGLLRALKRLRRDAAKLHADAAQNPDDDVRLADTQLRIAETEQRLTDLNEELYQLGAERVDDDDLRQALETFGPCWSALEPKEQARLLQLLIERVVLDGATSKLAITFRPSGIRALSDEIRSAQEVPA